MVVSNSFLYKMAREGKIPAVKIEYRENSKIKNLSVIKNPLNSLLKGSGTEQKTKNNSCPEESICRLFICTFYLGV
ncbi:MAG: hypothetical protein J7L64_01140 [Acidobacteria bacterium]|nr:hypothetical protein [Acidobacteriota bacterium]